MYKFVANIKDYTLLESSLGIYKITKGKEVVAHPVTEEQAWEAIKWMSGDNSVYTPTCWDACRWHNCTDCERYF